MQKCWNPGFVSGAWYSHQSFHRSQPGSTWCSSLCGPAGWGSRPPVGCPDIELGGGLTPAGPHRSCSPTGPFAHEREAPRQRPNRVFRHQMISLQFARRLNIQWRRFNKETAGPLRVDPPGLWSWCCCSRHPGFGSSDSAPRLQKCSQQRGRCNRRHRCPQGPQSQTDTGKVPYSGCSSQPAAKTHTHCCQQHKHCIWMVRACFLIWPDFQTDVMLRNRGDLD